METAKRQALTLIQNLPDDSTLEDIQYHLYVREKVERGLTDLKRGRTISQRQADERMQKWLKRSFGVKPPGLILKPSLTLLPETRPITPLHLSVKSAVAQAA